MELGSIVNKGEIGTGVALFSAEQRDRWEAQEEAMFGHDQAMLRWIRHGGELPK